jgi:hypothetical protein
MRSIRGVTIPMFVLLAGTATSAVAARDAPLIDHENIAVTSATSAANVKKAVVTAGGKRGWKPVKDTPTNVRLEYNARGKHLVVIDVGYNAKVYSIKYVASENMNYQEKDGKRYIHPKYNKWVDELIKGISLELATRS